MQTIYLGQLINFTSQMGFVQTLEKFNPLDLLHYSVFANLDFFGLFIFYKKSKTFKCQ